jgi:UDP-N-acetylmuramyl pentapeptide phosphotransferase/UDP-N-acetylglucosamine-1-phosphate transferase
LVFPPLQKLIVQTVVSLPVAMVMAFLGTVALAAVLVRLPLGAILLDYPNERSLHARPRPKLGGLAIMAVSLALVVLARLDVPAAVIAACAFLVVVSAIDDARNLSASVRLASHLGAASAVAIAVPGGNIFLAALAVATIAWMSNLYNFMDGADGLAGGMTAIGFGALALAANSAGATGLAAWCALVSASAAAFLCFNFPPARLFMGDAGAVPLGFLAGALGYVGFAGDAWPFWFPALVFSPFIFDASLTLFKRLLRGEKPWVAHREHVYQGLILAGWSHRKLALVAYILMLAVSSAAFAALSQQIAAQIAIIGVIVGSLGGLFLFAERHLRRAGFLHKSATG